MKSSAFSKKTLRSAIALSALGLIFGCSNTDTGGDGFGGASTLGGATATSGGASSGGSITSGGTVSSGGHVDQSGGTTSNGSGGASKGGTGSGGTATSQGGTTSASGGAASGGASAGAAGASAGAPTSGGAGGASGGATGSGGGTAAGGAGSFDPCPATDPCKILPLGDSITWGINYGGGYRIKLFIHTSTDKKNITFVGYDTANPPSAGVLSGLANAAAWSPKHEGHSGWTIQQDDDLVTGKSTANNDSVSYSGKKVVADFHPNIVLVHLGTNDMYQMPNGAPDRLGTLIDHVVADAPNALVVVASIIPFPSGASAVNTFNAAVPGVVKQRADAGKHVIYVDMFSALKTSDLGSDMVHPNEGGYEKMAVVWYNAIKSYLH